MRIQGHELNGFYSMHDVSYIINMEGLINLILRRRWINVSNIPTPYPYFAAYMFLWIHLPLDFITDIGLSESTEPYFYEILSCTNSLSLIYTINDEQILNFDTKKESTRCVQKWVMLINVKLQGHIIILSPFLIDEILYADFYSFM